MILFKILMSQFNSCNQIIGSDICTKLLFKKYILVLKISRKVNCKSNCDLKISTIRYLVLQDM